MAHDVLEEDSFSAMKKKLGNIDVVTKPEVPWPAPFPHHAGNKSDIPKAYSFESDPSAIQDATSAGDALPVIGGGCCPFQVRCSAAASHVG